VLGLGSINQTRTKQIESIDDYHLASSSLPALISALRYCEPDLSRQRCVSEAHAHRKALLSRPIMSDTTASPGLKTGLSLLLQAQALAPSSAPVWRTGIKSVDAQMKGAFTSGVVIGLASRPDGEEAPVDIPLPWKTNAADQ
jgi:hypothetical protein